MNLLAIDTATEACSVALWMNGHTLERWQHAPRGHADLTLQFVDSVLNEAGIALPQLDGIAFGAGPGAFTGVRIATACAQGLALGIDRPVIAISTLASLAQGAYRLHHASQVAVALDARMGEVYWGCYALTAEACTTLVANEVAAPHAVTLPREGEWHGAGNGWSVYNTALHQAGAARIHNVYDLLWPHATDIAALGARALQRGEGVAPELAQPVYLRNNVTG